MRTTVKCGVLKWFLPFFQHLFSADTSTDCAVECSCYHHNSEQFYRRKQHMRNCGKKAKFGGKQEVIKHQSRKQGKRASVKPEYEPCNDNRNSIAQKKNGNIIKNHTNYLN